MPAVLSPERSPWRKIKTIIAILCLILVIGSVAYTVWQRSQPSSAVPFGGMSTQQQDADTPPNLTDSFSDPQQGVPVPIHTCTPNETVALSESSTLTFTGTVAVVNDSFCQMTIVASGQYGTGAFDCSYKIDSQSPIFLQVDKSGVDQNFLVQHCIRRK